MPLKRQEVLYDGESLSRGGTWKDKLPDTGSLCGLLVVVEGTSVSGYSLATEKTWLEDFLDKVEILGNGSRVIKSVDFRDFAYFSYLDQGKVPPHWKRNYAQGTQRAMALINFGRHMWDTDFGIRLGDWDRVDLSITNSASSSTHTAALSVYVDALFFEDFPNPFPRGYLRTEEFKEWTTVQAAWEPTDLATEAPFRGIHLQLIPDVDSNYVEETGMYNVAYDLEFSIQNPKMYLHNGPIFRSMMINQLEQPGLPLYAGFADKTADYGFRTGLGYVYGMATASGSKDGAVSSNVPTINGDNNQGVQVLEDREADSPVQWMAYGMCPENFYTLHYSRMADPAWLLDPARLGNMRLRIQTRDASTAADGTIRILTDSIYPHPTR